MSTDKSVYFAQYYDDNKPAILAKRRLRYRNDPEYRKKMQEKARERARRKADERRAAKIFKKQAHADKIENTSIDFTALGPQKVKRWPVGEFVTASVVAMSLDISLGTLGNWLRSKTLPQPTISSTAGKHLFSFAYLELIRSCRIHALRTGMSNVEFKTLVDMRYEEISANEERLRRGESVGQ